MMKVKFWSGALVLAFLAVFMMGSVAIAGVTGKVAGTVINEAGQPLPGVNVVIEGTKRGATTDPDGFYTILSVDPGVYTAAASMVGYHPVSKERVSVVVDFTTTVDFQLREETLEMGELLVVAERPLVDPDKTESRYVVTAQDIERLPIIREMTDLVELEAGVSVDGTMQIRGSTSRYYANATFLDGVRLPLRGTKANQMWYGSNIKAVQEVTVITGGANAEYGNATGGILQIVTRDGGIRYHGEAEYKFMPGSKKHWGANVYEWAGHRGNMEWNDPAWVSEMDPVTGRQVHTRENYTDWKGQEVSGHFSGPITPSATVFTSGRWKRDASPFPNNTGSHWKPNYRFTSKATVSPGPNVKLRAGWIVDYRENPMVTGGGLRIAGRTGVSNVGRDLGRNIFVPPGGGFADRVETDNLFYAILTHVITPRTFYEVRVSHHRAKTDSSNAFSTKTTELRKEKDGYFNIGRDAFHFWAIGENRLSSFKVDLSSQFTKWHFIKAGIDFNLHDNWLYLEGSTPAGQKQNSIMGIPGPFDAVKPKQFAAYFQDKMEFEGLIVNVGLRYDRMWGQDLPLIGAMKSWTHSTLARHIQAPHFPMRPIVAWSPRLGISHPITARSSLHFFYGHFHIFPDLFQLFNQEWATRGGGDQGVQWGEYDHTSRSTAGASAIMNPFAQSEVSINFELGVDWNFVSDYTLSLTTFTKTVNNARSAGGATPFDPATRKSFGGLGYQTGNTYNYDIKGFELSLRKAFSNYVSIRAAYNAEWVEWAPGGGRGDITGNWQVFVDSSFVASGRYTPNWEVSGGTVRPVPLTDAQIQEYGHNANEMIRTLLANPRAFLASAARNPGKIEKIWESSWMSSELKQAAEGIYKMNVHGTGDRRTYGRRGNGSLQLFLSLPTEFGPKVGGITPLGGLGANMIYRIYTGRKFRYDTIDGLSSNSRGPVHTQTDLNVQKRLFLGPVEADLFVEVYNLFNQKDRSGFTDEDYMWWGLLLPKPNDKNYQEYGDSTDRNYLASPRQGHVGIRFKF